MRSRAYKNEQTININKSIVKIAKPIETATASQVPAVGAAKIKKSRTRAKPQQALQQRGQPTTSIDITNATNTATQDVAASTVATTTPDVAASTVDNTPVITTTTDVAASTVDTTSPASATPDAQAPTVDTTKKDPICAKPKRKTRTPKALQPKVQPPTKATSRTSSPSTNAPVSTSPTDTSPTPPPSTPTTEGPTTRSPSRSPNTDRPNSTPRSRLKPELPPRRGKPPAGSSVKIKSWTPRLTSRTGEKLQPAPISQEIQFELQSKVLQEVLDYFDAQTQDASAVNQITLTTPDESTSTINLDYLQRKDAEIKDLTSTVHALHTRNAVVETEYNNLVKENQHHEIICNRLETLLTRANVSTLSPSTTTSPALQPWQPPQTTPWPTSEPTNVPYSTLEQQPIVVNSSQDSPIHINISTHPWLINPRPGTPFNIPYRPAAQRSDMGGECLTVINITSGSEPYKGMQHTSLKDTGSSYTLMDRSFFDSHPCYKNARVKDVWTIVSTIDPRDGLTCTQYAELHLTFESRDKKLISFLHPVFLVRNLAIQFILGHDILGTKRTIYSTQDQVALVKDTNIPTKFLHLDKDPNVFIIPTMCIDVAFDKDWQTTEKQRCSNIPTNTVRVHQQPRLPENDPWQPPQANTWSPPTAGVALGPWQSPQATPWPPMAPTNEPRTTLAQQPIVVNSSPEFPIHINITSTHPAFLHPWLNNTKPGTPFHTPYRPQARRSDMGGECLTFIDVITGSKPYEGQLHESLKDTGSTYTLMPKSIFYSNPCYQGARVKKVWTVVTTVNPDDGLTCDEYAELYLTFETEDKRLISFLHPVFIVKDFGFPFVLGHDILGAKRTLYSTPNSVALVRDVSRTTNFKHLDKDPNIFIIPTKTIDTALTEDTTSTGSEQGIHIPTNNVRVSQQRRLPTRTDGSECLTYPNNIPLPIRTDIRVQTTTSEWSPTPTTPQWTSETVEQMSRSQKRRRRKPFDTHKPPVVETAPPSDSPRYSRPATPTATKESSHSMKNMTLAEHEAAIKDGDYFFDLKTSQVKLTHQLPEGINKDDLPTLDDLINLGFGLRPEETPLPQSKQKRHQRNRLDIRPPFTRQQDMVSIPDQLPIDINNNWDDLAHLEQQLIPIKSSKIAPVEITMYPKAKEPQPGDATHNPYRPAARKSNAKGESLPFITVTSGSEAYSGLPLLSLKDSGSSHTLINKSVFRSHPCYKDARVKKVWTNITTADASERLKCDSYAELYLTFESRDKKLISFLHPVFIVENMGEQFIIGHDILGTTRTIYSTPDHVALARDVQLPNKFLHLDKDPNIFIIPIKIVDCNLPSEIKMQRSILLPAKTSRVFHQPMLPALSYCHDRYTNEMGSLEAEVVPNTRTQQLKLMVTNHESFPQSLEIGDRLIPETIHAQITLTALIESKLLQDKIENDKYYSDCEKAEQLQLYRQTGECSNTASEYLDNHRRLQIFEPPLNKPDETPDELIAGLPLSHLDADTQEELRAMFRRNIACLAKGQFDVKHTTMIEARIDLKEGEKIMCPKYLPIPKGMRKEADELINFYISSGILAPADSHYDASPFISNLLFARKDKQGGKLRAILDSRIVNYNTKKLACSIASHAEIMDTLSGKRWISTLDLSNAYFSIPISRDTRKYTSFYSHTRQRLLFTSCPQGWINSAYYLDLLLSKLFGDMEGVTWVADDVLICTDGTVQEHLQLIERVLLKLIEADLRIKNTKVSIMQDATEFLGVIYNRGAMTIPKARCKGYEDLAPPKTPRAMKGFLASINFYKRWIPQHSELIRPLHEMSLLAANTKLKWSPEETKAFLDLKKAVRDSVALHLPQADRQFVCYSDASAYAISFVVEQQDEAGNRYPIAFLSKMLSKAERAYSIPKKESIALLYGLVAMDFWFSNSPKVIVNTDAQSLVWLSGCKGKNAFLTRVALQLSSYDLELRHIAGKDNIIADIMSRDTKGAADNPPGAERIGFLSEAETEQIVKRMTFKEGKIFTPEEVYELLTGESLPAAAVLPKPKAKTVRQVPIYGEQRRLPICKPTRKINMPLTRPFHQFYPDQKIRLAENKRHPPEVPEPKPEPAPRKRPTAPLPAQEVPSTPAPKRHLPTPAATSAPTPRPAPKRRTPTSYKKALQINEIVAAPMDDSPQEIAPPSTRARNELHINKVDAQHIKDAENKVIQKRITHNRNLRQQNNSNPSQQNSDRHLRQQDQRHLRQRDHSGAQLAHTPQVEIPPQSVDTRSPDSQNSLPFHYTSSYSPEENNDLPNSADEYPHELPLAQAPLVPQYTRSRRPQNERHTAPQQQQTRPLGTAAESFCPPSVVDTPIVPRYTRTRQPQHERHVPQHQQIRSEPEQQTVETVEPQRIDSTLDINSTSESTTSSQHSPAPADEYPNKHSSSRYICSNSVSN